MGPKGKQKLNQEAVIYICRFDDCKRVRFSQQICARVVKQFLAFYEVILKYYFTTLHYMYIHSTNKINLSQQNFYSRAKQMKHLNLISLPLSSPLSPAQNTHLSPFETGSGGVFTTIFLCQNQKGNFSLFQLLLVLCSYYHHHLKMETNLREDESGLRLVRSISDSPSSYDAPFRNYLLLRALLYCSVFLSFIQLQLTSAEALSSYDTRCIIHTRMISCRAVHCQFMFMLLYAIDFSELFYLEFTQFYLLAFRSSTIVKQLE